MITRSSTASGWLWSAVGPKPQRVIGPNNLDFAQGLDLAARCELGQLALHRRSGAIACAFCALIFLAIQLGHADDVMHPILTISGSGSGANTVTNIPES